MPTDRRRQELAAFVRSRRERRTPRDAGITVTNRRRTPGLRREEVAGIAGVSITWYTWLEQGRDIRVSRQVLGSLANALGLDPVERRHLFQLAGEVPQDAPVRSGSGVCPQYTVLLDHLNPNPAFLVNRRFDVLAWNPGAELFLGDLHAMPPEDRNVLWLMFTSDVVRSRSTDWAAEAAYSVALFRAQTGDGLLQPDVAALVARLSEASAYFAELWNRKELAPFLPETRTLHHPALGRVELEYVKMSTNDGLTFVAYLAKPGSALFQRLAELVVDR